MTSEIQEPVADFTIEDGLAFFADFERRLSEYVPDPTNRRLINGDSEYTSDELASMLQEFGAYVANLSALEGKMLGQENILKKGYKNALQIALAGFTSTATSVSGKEADFMASDEGVRFRKLQGDMINSESCLMLVRGWLKSYHEAYTAVSRVVTVVTSEQEMQ